MDQHASQPDFPGSKNQNIRRSLRKTVLAETGQDVFRCRGCGTCNLKLPDMVMDISLESLIQMVLQDDEEVLTSLILWSDEILRSLKYACQQGIDLQAVMLALREEAVQRNLLEGLAP